jgi:23S rRNA pseudouridine2605 synthase
MIRLQKLLAGAGLGSRRAIEEWIRAGRLSIGGRTATLGDQAEATDDIRLDGRKLELAYGPPAAAQLLLYYKPVGEVTTRRDPQGRPTVFERLPPPAAGRWITVGRLDVNTAGLLLLTTDGELAHRLMHPSSELEREYLVRLRGRPGAEAIRRVTSGVELEDGPARFDSVAAAEAHEGSHGTYKVVLREGRNREVRRIWSAVGFEVSRLLRIRYGPVGLPRDLKPGGTRLATGPVIEALKAQIRPAGPATGSTPGRAGPPPASPGRAAPHRGARNPTPAAPKRSSRRAPPSK